jgi:hypothetical protein
VWSIPANSDTATTIAPLAGFGTVTATTGPAGTEITHTAFDGNTQVSAAWCASLDCSNGGQPNYDGFGVDDDEITQTAQSIVFSWENPLSIQNIYLLDIFDNNNASGDPSWTEVALITINGVSQSFFGTANVGTTGELIITRADLISAGFTVANLAGVTSILFEAPQVCVDTACNDYAVAGISAVPIPGAVWLFGSAMLGLLGIGYKRKAAA